MSEYNMPSLGLFGKRCRIPYGMYGEPYVYRIVNSGIRSNTWCEPPLTFQSEHTPIQHDTMEEVLIVVCDTLISDDSKLIRVALKDVEIMDESDVLDKIRAEIEALNPEPTAYDIVDGNPIKDAVWETIADVLKIIDKYKAERSEE